MLREFAVCSLGLGQISGMLTAPIRILSVPNSDDDNQMSINNKYLIPSFSMNLPFTRMSSKDNVDIKDGWSEVAANLLTPTRDEDAAVPSAVYSVLEPFNLLNSAGNSDLQNYSSAQTLLAKVISFQLSCIL